MKSTPIRRISKKMREKLRREAKQKEIMLEACKGRCMVCGKWVGDKNLMKSHTRKRDRFIMSCYSCHFPGGPHKYLEEIDKC